MTEKAIHPVSSIVPAGETFPANGEGTTVTVQRKDLEMIGQYVGQLAGMVYALQQEVEKMRRDNAALVTVNHQQAKALMTKTRERAAHICAKYSLDEKKHGVAFRTAIKKAVLTEYGIRDLHDLPMGCYEAAKAQIAAYSNYALVRKRRGIEEGA